MQHYSKTHDSSEYTAVIRAVLPAEVKKSQRAELEALPDEYYGDDFSAVLFELQNLPPYFTKEDLDAVVEARAGVLEVCHYCTPAVEVRTDKEVWYSSRF